MNRLFSKSAIVISLMLLTVSGCTTNPVTGRSELSIVSEQQELAIGAQQYGPSKQSQGGEYTVDESLTRYVSEVGQRIAAVSERQLPYEFVVLNNSVPNAWALPGGKIAINRGLLTELNSEAELAAVLGHEVVHAAARHGAQAMTRGTLLQGALAVGAIASSNNEYSDFIVGGAMLGAQLITQRYGREAEREADYYGIQYMVRAGYDPQEAVSLQETFVRLSEGRNQSWLDGLFASHPPSRERVMNNQALVDELRPQLAGRDLEVGRERYQQAIAFLENSAPAYALYDEAQQAIADDDLEQAMEKLEQATAILPQEARFIGLQADILLYQRRYRQSVDSYDRAIAMDDSYFDYYLGRGVAYARLGSTAQARTDLERSSDLLPTAIAANELGKISLAANDRASAKQYFQLAASGQGRAGQEAAQAFTRLDVVDNPADYLQPRVFADNNGRIFARLSNRTAIDLRNITVEVSAILGDRLARQTVVIPSLRAGATVDVNSGLVFPQGQQWTAEQMAATINAVQVSQ